MWNDVKNLNIMTNALIGLSLLMVLASGLWWVIQRPYFTLQKIEIKGASSSGELRHVNELSIRNFAVPRLQGNFFTLNLDMARSSFEAVPWVRKASLQRIWPNKLVVSLEEHQVLGTWGENGRLVSVYGDIFTANLAEAEEDATLIKFSGPDGSEKEVVDQYKNLKLWFAPISLEPEYVQYSSRYAWTVYLNNGMRVELGRSTEPAMIKKRVEQLLKVYPQLVTRLQGGIESVDMRYPNGLALKSTQAQFRSTKELK
jgi:cell division protein FtsQ